MRIGKNRLGFTPLEKRDFLTGFTLIELIFVALLILILIGLSTPLFRRTISSLILKDSTFTISKLINYGQEKAIIERKNFKLSFDFQKGSYSLSEMDDSTEPPTYKRTKGKFGKAFTLPQGISFKGSKNELVFYPDGRCDEGDISIFNTKGEWYNISVRGFGSAIEIKEAKIEI